MGILETFFSSIVSGGITGILGVVVQRIADYKNRKLDMEANREKYSHEVRMREADAAIMAQDPDAGLAAPQPSMPTRRSEPGEPPGLFVNYLSIPDPR